jgi:hypothetical protein
MRHQLSADDYKTYKRALVGIVGVYAVVMAALTISITWHVTHQTGSSLQASRSLDTEMYR